MATSLRLRLFMIIVLPLFLIALALGAWRVAQAQDTAEELFDRDLLFMAVAVARDVALLDGDAISLKTQSLLGDASGGPVRYHVYAPDGAFVTGYAVPPIPVTSLPVTDAAFIKFDGRYKGDIVRVLRLWDVSQIGGLTGTFTITVWQDHGIRQSYVRDIALRSISVMAALITAVALCVWFGVNVGLKPLLDLEDAISRRNPEDLSPISRKVPVEAVGIVARFNTLMGQMQSTLAAQNTFISDAAHQLRNPIAGIRALGESISTAHTLDIAKSRATDLVDAATQAGTLANRLLTLERIRARQRGDDFARVDFNQVVTETVDANIARAKEQGVKLEFSAGSEPILVNGDDVMLGEAITNLLDNALAHGGKNLTRLKVTVDATSHEAILNVSDDGKGIIEENVPKVLARFGQVEAGEGSGLGMSIADAVARQHGGDLTLDTSGPGLTVCLTLPRS